VAVVVLAQMRRQSVVQVVAVIRLATQVRRAQQIKVGQAVVILLVRLQLVRVAVAVQMLQVLTAQ
jgi:hypothetical protein